MIGLVGVDCLYRKQGKYTSRQGSNIKKRGTLSKREEFINEEERKGTCTGSRVNTRRDKDLNGGKIDDGRDLPRL